MFQSQESWSLPRTGRLKSRFLARAGSSVPRFQFHDSEKPRKIKFARSIPFCLLLGFAFLTVTTVLSLRNVSLLLHTSLQQSQGTLDTKKYIHDNDKNPSPVSSDLIIEKMKRSKPVLPHARATTETPSCAVAGTIPPLLKLDSVSPAVLRAYAAMHAEKRACIVAQNCTEPPDVLVWQCVARICGGIGDRMRGIRLMFLMAVATQRVFFISWPRTATGPFSLVAVLLPAAVDWRLPKTASHTFRALPSAAMNFNDNYTVTTWNFGGERNRSKVFVDFAKTDFSHLMNPFKVIFASNRVRRYLLMRLTANPYAKNALKGLQRARNDLATLEQRVTHVLFRPTPAVQTAVAARTFANGVPYAAIHARTGDDTEEANTARLKHVSTHLQEAAQHLLACALALDKDVSRRIYLAADSRRFKLVFIKLARRHGIEVRTDLRPVLHVDRNVTGKHFRSRRALCDAFIDVFADMITLANASTFVFLRSGFAATAVSLSTSHLWRELNIDGLHASKNCSINNNLRTRLHLHHKAYR